MSEGKHILVPMDFGAASREARRLALQLAIRSGARLTLFHVLPSPARQEFSGLDAFGWLHHALHLHPNDARSTPTFASDEERAREEAIRKLLAEIHPEWHPEVEIHGEVARGEVAEEILRHCREDEVDTLVVGVRRPRWRPRLGSSTIDRLLREATCRVVLVNRPLTSGNVGQFVEPGD